MVIKAVGSPIFLVTTHALGELSFTHVSVGSMMAIEKAKIKNGIEFTDILIRLLGKKSDGNKITEADIQSLTSEERNEFITKFIEENPYLIRRKADKIIDEDGKRTVIVGGGNIEFPPLEGESSEDYAFRLYKTSVDKQRADFQKAMAPYTSIFDNYKSVFNPQFQDLFKQSRMASDLLGKSINQLSAIPPKLPTVKPYISPMDNIRTFEDILNDSNNANTDRVVERLEKIEELAVRMAETVKSVSDTASQFLIDFGIASDKVNKSSKSASWLAFVAIVLSLITTIGQIGWSEYKDRIEQNENSKVRAAFVSKLDGLLELEKELNASIENSNRANNKALLSASKNLERVANHLKDVTGDLSKEKQDSLISHPKIKTN